MTTPVAYTVREGGKWFSWFKDTDGNFRGILKIHGRLRNEKDTLKLTLSSSISTGVDVNITCHAIKFSNGLIWDQVNGFRRNTIGINQA